MDARSNPFTSRRHGKRAATALILNVALDSGQRVLVCGPDMGWLYERRGAATTATPHLYALQGSSADRLLLDDPENVGDDD